MFYTFRPKSIAFGTEGLYKMPVSICQFCANLHIDSHTLRTTVLLTFIVQCG